MTGVFDVGTAFGPLLKRLDQFCLNEDQGLGKATAEML